MVLPTILTLIGLALTICHAQVIFHGTTAIVVPGDQPGMVNAIFLTANFFTYATPDSYLSFGWWLPANGTTHHKHCASDSRDINWYETGFGNCTEADGCRFNARNFPVSRPKDVIPLPVPDEGFEYVVKPLDVGNGRYGKLSLSFVDVDRDGVYEGGGFGVGTRNHLTQEEGEQEECIKAVETFRWVVREYDVEFGHPILDVLCVKGSARRRPMWQRVQQLLLGDSRGVLK